MSFELSSSEEKASQYLKTAELYRLGEMVTEKSHPETYDLSTWAQKDLDRAFQAIQKVDIDALEELSRKAEKLEPMQKAIQKALSSDNKVFICGCGATGRLALTLEFLWREKYGNDSIVGFMAGGDLALIRSIESFEDYPEFGARQLRDLGFKDGDLLIAVTEGGETPFVIGATHEALKTSSLNHYFLYCNPTELLIEKVQRSREIIENKRVKAIDLSFEPMVLSGSTRLQACTVQLLATGACLFQKENLAEYLQTILEEVKALDFSMAHSLVERESEIYQKEGYVLYRTDDFGMTVLTDTTERSPTFSLNAFEDFNLKNDPVSLCYFNLKNTSDVMEAWEKLLERPPRPLDWKEYEDVAGPNKLSGYDFSSGVFAKREASTGQAVNYVFDILRSENGILFELDGEKMHWEFSEYVQNDSLAQHLLLKIWANAHSTLVMGRLGRYESNWMTWVKPSNGKLIDRATRYVQGLYFKKTGHELDYAKAVHQLFREMEKTRWDEPLVLKTLDSILDERSRS